MNPFNPAKLYTTVLTAEIRDPQNYLFYIYIKQQATITMLSLCTSWLLVL